MKRSELFRSVGSHKILPIFLIRNGKIKGIELLRFTDGQSWEVTSSDSSLPAFPDRSFRDRCAGVWREIHGFGIEILPENVFAFDSSIFQVLEYTITPTLGLNFASHGGVHMRNGKIRIGIMG